jgi:hypothetical protein
MTLETLDTQDMMIIKQITLMRIYCEQYSSDLTDEWYICD